MLGGRINAYMIQFTKARFYSVMLHIEVNMYDLVLLPEYMKNWIHPVSVG